MSDQPTNESEAAPVQSSRSIHWTVASVIAVVALIAGVLLGRVAFVSTDESSPRVTPIEVLDEELEVGGSVEYIEDEEVYILSIYTMPPPPEGQVFQVWVQTDDVIVSAGVLNPDSRVFAYAAYSGRYDTLFVTQEPGPFGSEQPTTEELVTADLTELEDEDD